MSVHLLNEVAVVAANSGGVLDWVNQKNAETLTAVRGLSGTVAVIFVIWAWVKSRGSLIAIILAIITAAVGFFGVWNITDISDRVDTEVNGAPSRSVLMETSATASAAVPFEAPVHGLS